MQRLLTQCASLGLLGLFVACGGESDNLNTQTTSPVLEDVTNMPDVDLDALGVPYATMPQPGLLCAGQISQEQMDALAAAGYGRFISLRVAEEKGAGWEEGHAATTGLEFVRVPVAGAAGVDEAAARRLRTEMEKSDVPTVLYCGSSNRVGALLGIAKVKIDGASPSDGLAFAKSAGLTGLEPVFRERVGLE